MQEAANKQKRMTLKTLHEMLNGMSEEGSGDGSDPFLIKGLKYPVRDKSH